MTETVRGVRPRGFALLEAAEIIFWVLATPIILGLLLYMANGIVGMLAYDPDSYW